MNSTPIQIRYIMRRLQSIEFFKITLFVLVFFAGASLLAQERQLVQVKTFTEGLKAYGNLSVSVNEGAYFSVDSKGTAFIELNAGSVKSVNIKDVSLEAASWILSEGILEIIVRRKNYQIIPVYVMSSNGNAHRNLKVVFNGKKTITTTTDQSGKIELPLALNESINAVGQFKIEGYETLSIQSNNGGYELLVDKIQPKVAITKEELPIQEKAIETPKPVDEKYFQSFDFNKLDSIQSLTVFYAMFKNYQIEKFDEELKRKVDAKFESLVAKLQDSIKQDASIFVGNITDTTNVQNDIKTLLNHARLENQLLAQQKIEFEEKIQVINEKLEIGFENLDENARAELLTDINILEQLLKANEDEFYKNQSNYLQVINGLKDKFFDIEELEGKLSASEAQRLEDQRIFRQRLIAASVVVLVFAILTILLIYFSNRLKKQKKALIAANAEVKRVNENLEEIVHERTRLLEETYRELDTVLYRASHDLRSPVCSIVGLCNIVTFESGEDEMMNRMVKTTTDMDRLLKKLSVISEIHQPGDFSQVKLIDIIDRIYNHFKPFIEAHNIELKVECQEDLSLETIPNLIEVIIANLIENALYYSMVKGMPDCCVELKVEIVDDELVIAVIDNGIGFDPSSKERLFDMFYRGTEHSKGNGLGLYIVQKSIHVLNGSIDVESEYGVYSKFTVNLPLAGSREHKFSFLYERDDESDLMVLR